MNKTSGLIFIMCACFSGPVFSQVQFGFDMGLQLSMNRVASASDTLRVNADGVGGRIAVGPTLTFQVNPNFAFSTGLLYSPKRVSYTYRTAESTVETNPRHSLQQLRIPVEMIFYTNEVALDYRIYIKAGGGFDITVNQKDKEMAPELVQKFSALDTYVLLGFGLSHQLGVTTNLMAGISYSRGLVNIANGDQITMDQPLQIKNDLVSLDVRLLF